MERLYFTLKRTKNEANEDLDASKLLGAPVMPEGFFDSLPLNEMEYFVAQIRCDQFPARPPFPDKGYLYIFVDINTLKPRVVYTEKEPGELLGDINDAFDKRECGDPTCLQMVFGGEQGCFLFGGVDHDTGIDMDVETEGKLTLLQIDGLALPQGRQKPLIFGNFGMGDGYWVFLIDEQDLAKRNFDNVELYEVEA